MSFILDALKRSENERQRQTGPGLAAAPEGGTEQRRSPWLGVVVALLLVNLGVLGFLLSRPAATPESAASATAPAAAPERPADRRVATMHTRGDTPAPTPKTPVVTAGPTSSLPAERPAPAPPGHDAVAASGTLGTVPRDAGELPEERNVRSLGDEVVALEDVAADASAEPVAAPRRAAPEAVAPAAARRSAAGHLPTVQELTLKGEFSGRPLHLDLHVYYDDPSRRLVFINGSKYREGERIDDGLRVAEIVPDGVVLDDGRQRFLLPAT
jgi:general secretion pathway protein B